LLVNSNVILHVKEAALDGNQSDRSGKGASVPQTSYLVVLVSPSFWSQYAIARRIADLCFGKVGQRAWFASPTPL
jgi:hypothetical protein